MTTLRFRLSGTSASTELIGRLRELTALSSSEPRSISELQARIAARAPLFEITAFTNTWQDDKDLLLRLADALRAGTLPLVASEVHDETESPVSPDMLGNLIDHLAEIERQASADALGDSDADQGPSGSR